MAKKVKYKINKLRKKLKRELRNLGRSTENVIKEAAIPIIITVSTGGTGVAIAKTVAGVAVSRQAKKKIKDPVAKAVVGTAITASFGGCKNLHKEVAKAVVTTTVAKKTKSGAVGAIISSGVCGDYKNISEVGKGILKEVVSENVVKTVSKKTNNQLLIEGAGHLARAGVDHILSQPKSRNIDIVKEKCNESKKSSDFENIIEENNKLLLDKFNNNKNNNYNCLENIIEENNKLLLDNFNNNNNIYNFESSKLDLNNDSIERKSFIKEKFKSPNEVPLEESKSILNKKIVDNEKSALNFKNKIQPNTNLDSGKSTVSLKTVFNSDNSNVLVTNDLKNIKV